MPGAIKRPCFTRLCKEAERQLLNVGVTVGDLIPGEKANRRNLNTITLIDEGKVIDTEIIHDHANGLEHAATRLAPRITLRGRREA